MRLARLLVTYRKNNTLLQKEIADQLSISREHYAQIESGKFVPSMKLLQRISKRLNLEISIRVAKGGATVLGRSERELLRARRKRIAR